MRIASNADVGAQAGIGALHAAIVSLTNAKAWYSCCGFWLWSSANQLAAVRRPRGSASRQPPQTTIWKSVNRPELQPFRLWSADGRPKARLTQTNLDSVLLECTFGSSRLAEEVLRVTLTLLGGQKWVQAEIWSGACSWFHAFEV